MSFPGFRQFEEARRQADAALEILARSDVLEEVHRIREAISGGELSLPSPMGGGPFDQPGHPDRDSSLPRPEPKISVEVPAWSVEDVSAQQIIDGIRSLKAGSVLWWIDFFEGEPADRFLLMARDGFGQGGDGGWCNAVAHAKRAASRQLDALLKQHHLDCCAGGRNYKSKIDLLRKVGVDIPGIVFDRVLAPRNILEHEYCLPSEEVAKDSVETAALFVPWAEDIIKVGAPVMLNPLFDYDWGTSKGVLHLKITRMREGTMVFIDRWANPPSIKIIRVGRNDIIRCPLESLADSENVELGSELRRWSRNMNSVTALGSQFFKEFRAQLKL